MINFSKYSATGNDFIVIDNRNSVVDVQDSSLWKKLCKRRTGIGADGVLLVEKTSDSDSDFRMRYINSDDGLEAEMCGNGGRAILDFYHKISGEKKSEYFFTTFNSRYKGNILNHNRVSLKMTELYDENLVALDDYVDYEKKYYVNTGVPHLVLKVNSVTEIDVDSIGRKIRNDSRFKNGCNVNFIEMAANNEYFKIRTYERGVEKETLSCGTGITASALACKKWFNFENEIDVYSHDFKLKVKINDDRSAIYLIGEVSEVFKGNFSP